MLRTILESKCVLSKESIVEVIQICGVVVAGFSLYNVSMDAKRKKSKTLWDKSAKSMLTLMLCDAVNKAANPMDMGTDLGVQWESQAEGRERTMALLGAFSLAGEGELRKAATMALSKLTLVGGGAVYAGGKPGRDAGVAWAVKVLVEAGASADTYDEEGWSPIHQQACLGHTLAIEALVDGGVHPGLKTKKAGGPVLLGDMKGRDKDNDLVATDDDLGLTADEYARENGHDELADWIKRKAEAVELEKALRSESLWIIEAVVLDDVKKEKISKIFCFDMEYNASKAGWQEVSARSPGQAWKKESLSPLLPITRSKICSTVFSNLLGSKRASAGVANIYALNKEMYGGKLGSSEGSSFCVGIQRVSIGGSFEREDFLNAHDILAKALGKACGAISVGCFEVPKSFEDLSPYGRGWKPGELEGQGQAIDERRADAMRDLVGAAKSVLEKASMLSVMSEPHSEKKRRSSI